MTKEEVWKVIESKINTLQSLTIECVELIYNGAYNEAIEAAAKRAEQTAYDVGSNTLDTFTINEIRKLKK